MQDEISDCGMDVRAAKLRSMSLTEEMAEDADLLRDLIAASTRVVAFTGAGISTESGIPDYRSPGGIWTKMAPIEFRDFVTNEAMRREAWRRKFAMDEHMALARPNAGHLAIAELARRGKVTAVITQNIDNLHQVSGVPVERIIELHGNTTYATCLECGLRHELDVIKQSFLGRDELPVCRDCGGLVKTATISFGQAMPEDKMIWAERETLSCDLFIVIGSSLAVYPAASFPVVAKRNGAKLVIINREATPIDDMADLVVNAEIGPVLARVVV